MHQGARRGTKQEYLRHELDSDVRHEFLGGQIVAMAGASPRHNQVKDNALVALRRELANRGCFVTSSDQRVHVVETGGYVYPDVVAVCEQPQFNDDNPPALTNPNLVVEVLSPTTADHDRGAKFGHYRVCASVREVLFLDPETGHAEHRRRLDTGQWMLTHVDAGSVELAGLGITLQLAELFAHLEGLPGEST
ncbi:MAG: Uma2 family endonuclease [Polyangiaceae bacterium]|nr:Uma2 family endonuclease [Polyangiaceae bacterium]